MIFSIKLNIDIDKKYFEDSYYIVLGSILNLIGDNQELKDSILTISNIYKKDHDFFCVKISIYKKENFNLIINKIFDNKEININGKLYKITGIDFNFEILDTINIETKQYLYIALKLVNMIGLGTGARMGLGQVGVYFSN